MIKSALFVSRFGIIIDFLFFNLNLVQVKIRLLGTEIRILLRKQFLIFVNRLLFILTAQGGNHEGVSRDARTTERLSSLLQLILLSLLAVTRELLLLVFLREHVNLILRHHCWPCTIFCVLLLGH